MKVITISGHATAGKDTLAQAIQQEFKAHGISSMIVHYADFLKMILFNYYGIDCSIKTPEVRTALQEIGTGVFRKNSPDIFVNFMLEFIRGLGNTVKVLIIADARFPNEIIKIRESCYVDGLYSIRIERSGNGYATPLTEAQTQHASETALDTWHFDCIVNNDLGLEEFRAKAAKVVELFNLSQKQEIPVI